MKHERPGLKNFWPFASAKDSKMKLTGQIKDNSFYLNQKKQEVKNGRKIPRIWVLVTDSHLARIYKRTDHSMELIGEAEPEQSPVETEISNKTMGRMASAAGSTVHHKFEPHDSFLKHDQSIFSGQISEFFELAETADIYDKLVVIAAPKMLGNLRKDFSKLVKNHIVSEIDKDLTKLDDRELETALKKIVWF